MKLLKKQPNEKDIQKTIIDYLNFIGAVVVKVNNVGIMKPNGRYIPPREKGISDIIACFRGRFLAIEVKRPGNKPTIEQQLFLERINNAGGVGFWVDSLDEVERHLESLK